MRHYTDAPYTVKGGPGIALLSNAVTGRRKRLTCRGGIINYCGSILANYT